MGVSNSYARARRLLTGLAYICIVVGPISGRAAEVYKHVDAQGRVTYSDHPVSKEAQKVEIRVQEANTEEAARIGREQALLAADDKRRETQKVAERRAEAKQAAADDAQKQRCMEARRQYQTVANNSRVYRLDDQGNRVYYSGPELDARRVSAKATMDRVCGS